MKDLMKLREFLDAVIEQNEGWLDKEVDASRRKFYEGKVQAYSTVRQFVKDNIKEEV